MIIGKGGIESGSKVFGAGGVDNGTRIFGEGGELSGSYVFNKDILTATNIATLSDTQYGTIDTAVTFGAGEDFRIDVEYSSTETSITAMGAFGYSVGTTNYLQLENAAGLAAFATSDGNIPWTHGNVHRDGKVRTLTAFRTGLTIGIELDGVVKNSAPQAAASQVDIDFVGCLGVASSPSQFFKGQVLSIKFTNVTTSAVRNFVFDSGSTTEQYARGSTTDKITLLNFALADWSRYTLQRNILHDAGTVALGWVGENVVVNGRFDDASAWALVLSAISGGVWEQTGAGTASGKQAILRANDIYLYGFSVTELVGTLAGLSNGSFAAATKTAAGTYKGLGAALSVDLTVVSTTVGNKMDNVSAQHLLEVV